MHNWLVQIKHWEHELTAIKYEHPTEVLYPIHFQKWNIHMDKNIHIAWSELQESGFHTRI